MSIHEPRKFKTIDSYVTRIRVWRDLKSQCQHVVKGWSSRLTTPIDRKKGDAAQSIRCSWKIRIIILLKDMPFTVSNSVEKNRFLLVRFLKRLLQLFQGWLFKSMTEMFILTSCVLKIKLRGRAQRKKLSQESSLQLDGHFHQWVVLACLIWVCVHLWLRTCSYTAWSDCATYWLWKELYQLHFPLRNYTSSWKCSL